MKNTIFKKRWRKGTPNCYIEYGWDPENNRFGFGVSSELELKSNLEIRYPYKLQIKNSVKEIYIRVWILKYCLSIGTGEVEFVKKNRVSFKFVIGLASTI